MFKKTVFVLVFIALALSAVTAFAQGPDHGYCSQPGCEVSASQTICQGHGAFGAFGEQGDVVHDFGVNNLGSNEKPGTNGQATGYNNSHLCGNPQNSP